MNITLCLKQPAKNFSTSKHFSLEESDKTALSHALCLQKSPKDILTVLLLSPPEGQPILREVASYGADRLFLIDSTSFPCHWFSDPALILAASILFTGFTRETLLLFGRQAADGDSSHIAGRTAAFLNLPFISSVKNFSSVSKGHSLEVKKEINSKQVLLSCVLPALASSGSEGPSLPSPGIAAILKAHSPDYILPVINFSVLLPYLKSLSEASPFPFSGFQEKILPASQKLPSRTPILLKGKNDEETAALLLNQLEQWGFNRKEP